MRRVLSLLMLIAITAAACGGDSVFSLQEGDCFNDPSSFDQVSEVDTVDCAEPHDNEVYLISRYQGGGSYPGAAAMEQAAFTACLGAFEDFVGAPYETSRFDIAALWPSQESWDEAGDRDIICAVYDLTGAKVTGSIRGLAE